MPEAAEKEAWGNPTFRVKDKIFAMQKSGDGRVSVWLKAPPGAQEILVGAAPKTSPKRLAARLDDQDQRGASAAASAIAESASQR